MVARAALANGLGAGGARGLQVKVMRASERAGWLAGWRV